MRQVLVTIVRDRLDHLRRQRERLAADPACPRDHVVVVMGGRDPQAVLDLPGPRVHRVDLDSDGPLPLAAARNRGIARAASLGAEQIVLLDVDVLPDAGALLAFAHAGLRHPSAVLIGPVRYRTRDADPDDPAGATTPDPRNPPPVTDALPIERRSEFFWSLNYAVAPAVHDHVGGYDEAYLGYGAEDTDLGLRIDAAGVPLRWVPGAGGAHQWHPTQAIDTRAADLVRNATTFHKRWGRWPMADWLRDLHDQGAVHFDPARNRLELLDP